jgi:hypothetical protein
MNHYLPNATEVATLTRYLGHAYAEEKKTRSTRFRISLRTLRKIAGRTILREAFLDEWANALGSQGWTVIYYGDHYGVIRSDAIDGWARLSSKRIAADLENMSEATIRRIGRRLQ